MRRRAAIEYKTAMRIWHKLGISPISDAGNVLARQRGLVSKLSEAEKELMLRAAAESNEIAALAKLREMHPGIRELRIRNYINSRYAYEGWEESVEKLAEAGKGLCGKLGLYGPTAQEKLDAVKNHGNLNGNQLDIMVEGKLGKTNAEKTNVEMTASITLKLRGDVRSGDFTIDDFISKLSYEEVDLLLELAPGIQGSEGRDAVESLQVLDNELREKIDRRSGLKPLHESVLKLQQMDRFGIEELREALARKKDHLALLEFMGMDAKDDAVVFRDERVMTRAKGKVNDDTGFSADIEYKNGGKARFDAVFDGVSRSTDGSGASHLAAEVFKIMLQLRAPESAEELKTIMTAADLAIINAHGLDGRLDSSATTVVATLLKGNVLTAVHAGDSRWMVFSSGRLYERSRDHTYEEKLREMGHDCPAHLKENVVSTLGNVFDFIGSSELALNRGDTIVLCSDGISAVVCEHEIACTVSEGIPAAAEKIMGISEGRKDENNFYKTECGCELQGKTDDRTVIVFPVESGEAVQERPSLDLSFGRSRMFQLAVKLGVEQSALETAMIEIVRMMKGTYDPLVSAWPTEEETFEVEMILESDSAEKMARMALLLGELRKPEAVDRENKFRELHSLVRSLDGDGAVQVYDRFHALLSESGNFRVEDVEKAARKKKVRKLRKRKKR